MLPKSRFLLGRPLATPAALAALAEAGVAPLSLLVRHVSGDWGDVDAHDRQANEDAVRYAARVLSIYTLADGEKVWVLTEADRSVTTILLGKEY